MFATNVQPVRGIESPGLAGPSAIVDVVPRMIDEGKAYNKTAAYVMAVASAWAYSDEQTLWETLNYIGFNSRCYSLIIVNDALLLRTRATLIQHEDGKVAILCFRGTEPVDILHWLADASFEVEPFFSSGRVHGGFYRSIRPMWPYLRCRIGHAIEGAPVVDVDKEGAHFSQGSISCPEMNGARPAVALEPLEALYLTGHSFGGALAALTAALIFQDEEHERLQRRLFGVYTFGQPAVGDDSFARWCDDKFGSLYFRHVYGQDLMPRLPPRTSGDFRHFGQAYGATREGWSRREGPSAAQAWSLTVSTLLGAAAWVTQQFPLFPGVKLPFSLADHSPFNYVRVSRRALGIIHSEFG